MPRLSKRKKKVAEKEEGLRKMTDETKVKKAKKKKKGIKKKRKHIGKSSEVTTLDDGQNFTDEDLETFRLCGAAFLEVADHKYMGAWRRDVENFVVKVVQELSCEGSLNSHDCSQAHHRRALRRALAEEFLRLRPIMSEIADIVGDNRC